MAFTRKFLSALGIEAEKIDEIMDAHVEVVNGLKTERDNYKADAEKLVDVEKKLTEANEKIAKNGDGETVSKEDFDKVSNELTELKTKETKRIKEHAFRELYKSIGIAENRIDTVMKVTNLDDVELDKDGKLKDADKRSEKAKEEWKDFIVTTEEKGAKTPNPPANNSSKMSKEQIVAMTDREARQKAIAENIDLFR